MKKILETVLVLSMAALLWAEYAQADEPEKSFVLNEGTPVSPNYGYAGLSTRTEPVDILSYGVHFHIPRNYITSILRFHSPDNSMDKNVDFTLIAAYPDFNGVIGPIDDTLVQTTNNRKWNWGISHNLIMINTIGGAISKEGYNEGIFNAEKNEPDHPWKYGLLQSTKKSWAIQNIYFQRPNNNSPGIVVFCNTPKNVLQECETYTRVSDKLILHTEFHIELLPHWKEINDKLNNLIQSFVVKQEK